MKWPYSRLGGRVVASNLRPAFFDSHRSITLASLAFVFCVGLGYSQSGTALVRHAPTINGTLDGSIQQVSAESVSLNSGGSISGELLVPGVPSLQLNGTPTFGGVVTGSGSATPTNYQITLNSGSSLGHLHTRVDPLTLQSVTAPASPAGTRSVSLNSVGQSPGDFATLRNLTLNSNVGQIVVPTGIYGDFSANSGSGFTLGVVGSTTPTTYAFQHLTLNSSSQLSVVGPVIITVANGVSLNSSVGSQSHPEWLVLQLSSGGLTLNSAVVLYGSVLAPNGTVTIGSNSQLLGGVVCDRLTINSNGLVRPGSHQPPVVALTLPANGASFVGPASITLQATATSPSDSITKVDFYNGSTLLGTDSSVPYQFIWTGVVSGTYTLTAVATDNRSVTSTSSAVAVTVTAPAGVTLTPPTNGGALASPATISLTAVASGGSGAVTKVELYRGTALIGTLTSPTAETSNYTFSDSSLAPGTYVYLVRSYDSTGGYVDSIPLTITVRAGLPYLADFESTEGYSSGALSGQLGWAVTQGSAQVSNAEPFDGSRAVSLPPSSPSALLAQTFAPVSGENVVFADFFAKPVADADINHATNFMADVASFGFVLNNVNQGNLQAFSGTGQGSGQWVPTEFSTPVDQTNRSIDYIRLTARVDYTHKTWDLYADKAMVAGDLGFTDSTSTYFGLFAVQGHPTGVTAFDDLLATADNPLFTDINSNGLDDAWETAHGLSLNDYNRNLTPSGNGLTVLQAYLQGFDPNDFYRGQVPTLSITGGNNQSALPGQFNTQALSVLVKNSAGVTPLANAPVIFSVTQGGGLLASNTSGSGSISSSLTIRTGIDGSAQVYFQQPGTPTATSQISAAAGNVQVVFQSSTAAGDDYYHGVTPAIVSLQNPSGRLSSDGALSVLVFDADGTPLANAPVVFTSTTGSHLLSVTAGGQGSISVQVVTNAQGMARAYVVSASQ